VAPLSVVNVTLRCRGTSVGNHWHSGRKMEICI